MKNENVENKSDDLLNKKAKQIQNGELLDLGKINSFNVKIKFNKDGPDIDTLLQEYVKLKMIPY